ncbi:MULTISPECIES: DUF2891 domain-containing protein [Streptomycetaceae]|uniref:DUF2891 domain-containing protein n=1 Tax=Streptantibioticus cattleyicolor (strain ATCC 35852 / DSM 46488 / JCM 4925 / NBRC 14057 / NRRL 8057) TaxID=1003195 RepID=F8K449_STREN|nr:MULTISPECIES: DUF2891 domain-containing protein [Streptomycetaceae]AEW92590.1 hypothetical protein SCATT_02190 [Streptantibioticus cattleyicolor NRRL 8057 = DSM 46488]MYS57372.1 DUF2891 family protein [Streptomyces sp. SID5468]CCB72945.1 conserved protein of unknown function [Streptantibioticus cattleyicolor NRRL 8057 = DSM 46488]
MTPDQPRSAELARRAADFARLAAANVTRPYPYAPAHLLTGPDDLLPPSHHHPAFCGSYDWHSSVHMHWLLVRLLRRYHDHVETAPATAVLDRHLTADRLATEAAYLRANPSFERPYGWAWLLALTAECRRLGPAGERWADALEPAADTVAELLCGWLAKAAYPVRHGTHTNSAFALGLVLDSAPVLDRPRLAATVTDTVLRWFADDHDAPAHWEPSGQDFLSPALTEADTVRRVLPSGDLARWLSRFLPALAPGTPSSLLTPPTVTDPADPQIGHLVGLSLSRAAALRSLAAALPPGDPRTAVLADAATAHLSAALPHTATGDFTGDHWLATFAVLALEAAV